MTSEVKKLPVADLVNALVFAAMLFQKDYQRNRLAEQIEREELDDDELSDAGDEDYPETLDEDTFMEYFKDFVEDRGISCFKDATLSPEGANHAVERLLFGKGNKAG